MKKVRCINVKPLVGNDVAPPLVLGNVYEVKEVLTENNDKKTQHFDVGLISKFNYVSSRDTGIALRNSAKGGIHWCSPDRFEEVNP